MTLNLLDPLVPTNGLRGVIVASELAADRSGLLTELGGVLLSAEAVSSVRLDLFTVRESSEPFVLSFELFLDFRLVWECEMRRQALESEGMLKDGGPARSRALCND